MRPFAYSRDHVPLVYYQGQTLLDARVRVRSYDLMIIGFISYVIMISYVMCFHIMCNNVLSHNLMIILFTPYAIKIFIP